MAAHPNSKPARAVAVLGAAGHTGRFVVAELLRRGLTPVAVGREAERLRAAGFTEPDVECRQASIDDAGAIDRAIAGAAAVITAPAPSSTPLTRRPRRR